jgi:hypothetical protein
MSPPQARDWARWQPPVPPAAFPGGRAQAPAPDPGAPYLVSVAWGTVWRYAAIGLILVGMFVGFRPPLLAAAVVAAAGVGLGLWYRRLWVAGLWRAVMLGWGIGEAGSHWFFPYVVVAALVVVTVEPWLVARRRRSRPAPAPPPPPPPPPPPLWPQARQRSRWG